MKRILLGFSLLSLPIYAANSFPPCAAGKNINQVWQAQDSTFWWCNGATWQPVTANPDGGTMAKGTLLLDGGSPTATVTSGSVCVCSNLAPLDGGTVHNTTCTVASTTMTAAGNKGDSIGYLCF